MIDIITHFEAVASEDDYGMSSEVSQLMALVSDALSSLSAKDEEAFVDYIDRFRESMLEMRPVLKSKDKVVAYLGGFIQKMEANEVISAFRRILETINHNE